MPAISPPRQQRHARVISICLLAMLVMNLLVVGILMTGSTYHDRLIIIGDAITYVYLYLACPVFLIANVWYFIRYGFTDRRVNFAPLKFVLLFVVFFFLALCVTIDRYGFNPHFG